ncbi:MAG: pyridoxal phosphate-dependent aminotransferase [Chloroflexi bacterium]|nr:pyridoxal phosphate-dependent aminotransferase [Chloroflexota bacterium]
MHITEAVQRLGSESAFEVLARARALEARGVEVVHLEIGEPDFPTPPHVVAAGVAALEAGDTHYGSPQGSPALRRAIAEDLGRRAGLNVDPEQVVVTPGAKPVMFFTILAFAGPGDEVLYPSPGFPIYESLIRYVGATPVALPLYEARDFRFDYAELRRLVGPRTRLIILNSPHNPTGGVLTAADLDLVAELAVRHDCAVLSDEIYRQIVYGATHESVLTRPGMAERTVVLDGFSKAYAMTGWRLGYGIFPPALVPHVVRLAINSYSCVPGFVQQAGLAALRGPQDAMAAMVDEFRARRALLVEGLRCVPGLRCRWPQGAFYAFPNVTGSGLDDRTFADELLGTHGVATLAGSSFGAHGAGHVRISFANSPASLGKALGRIGAAMAALRARAEAR